MTDIPGLPEPIYLTIVENIQIAAERGMRWEPGEVNAQDVERIADAVVKRLISSAAVLAVLAATREPISRS